MIRRTLLLLVTLGVVSGCASDAPTAVLPPAGITLADIVINDPLTGDVAYSHGDHWHGALRLVYGDTRRHRIFFVERGQASHDAPDSSQRITLRARPDLQFRVEFEDPTLARWVGDGVEGAFLGQYPGGTRVLFSVWFGAQTVFRAPPVAVVVRP
ncbi:hypothetical protein [Gemmatimonas sp.]|uniref:hypothetical protein n=1 Tax=Gemmatimonas sp. TaxID=1962908 RepID=UPI0025C1C99C|nr:hypothetical protein [Gemmatimonas sp.]MCA2985184.1 hypothetical protein [Gemmatimonas sp.]MCA2995826.1 hypothetical protein [Gemmatimonas sp.]